MIELIGLNKSFVIKKYKGKERVNALNNVSLTINDGEIYGIIGFSGAGKSTLVRCINLIEVPDVGNVIIDGIDITKLRGKNLRENRKKIGMIFQHFNLMPSRTVFDNVAFPLKNRGKSRDEIKKRVEELLELVDIHEKIYAYPSELSGGQKQRVAIARALANHPNILLCDEATSALDPQTTKQILSLLKKINSELNVTICIITHEMEVIKDVCTRVAVMENGEVVEEGTVFDIFANPIKAITKRFINTTSNVHKIYDLVNEDNDVTKLKGNELIVRLSYIEQSPSEALITKIARRYNVDFNIIFADVEMIGNCPIGGTVAILRGDSLDEVIEAVKKENVGVEVIKDGRVSNNNSTQFNQ